MPGEGATALPCDMTHTPDPLGTRRDFLHTAGLGLVAAAVANAAPLAPPDKQPPDLKMPEVDKTKLGYAIVGLGELALEEILPAFKVAKRCKPVALVSGHPEKAKAVAEAYAIHSKNIYSYENYDKLADNPAVDIIYIVLPNHMHADFTVRGLKAGKHVLCEKPMATSVEECRNMIAASKAANKKLMIAYRLHYEPFNQTAMKFGQGKVFGPVRHIEAMNFQNTKAPNIRLTEATAGGPLGDTGVYCINAARYLTGEEPVEVTAFARKPQDDPRFAEVPAGLGWQVRFPSGALATCSTGFDGEELRYFRVACEKGWFGMDAAFSYKGQKLLSQSNKQTVEYKIDPVDHFAAEMDDFAQRITKNEESPTPGEEGLKDLLVIGAINRSIEAGGKPIKVDPNSNDGSLTLSDAFMKATPA